MSFEISPRRKKACIAFLFIVIWVIADAPYLMSYLTTGHDLFFHLYRIEGIADGLKAGQFPVRMQYSQLSGYGYPVSIMYGDIFLYPIAILHLLGMSISRAYQLFVLTINALTLILTYYICKRVFRSELIGVVAAALWTMAPYRLMDVYLRVAVGEYMALFFAPMLFYGLYLIFTDRQGRYRSILWTAAGCCGIVMSHALSVMMFAIPGVLFVVYGLVKNHSLTVIKRLLLAAVCFLACSAWFIVPFLDYYRNVEMSVRMGSSAQKQANMWASAIQPSQILTLFQQLRGGNSDELSVAWEMPFAVGWALLAGGCIWFLSVLVGKFKSAKEKRDRNLSVMIAVVAIIVTVMATKLFIWYETGFALTDRIVGVLATLQFPWRFVGVSSVLLVALTCFGLAIVRGTDGLRAFAAPLAIALIACSALECGSEVTTFLSYSRSMNSFSYAKYYPYGIAGGEYLLVGTDSNQLISDSQSDKYPSCDGCEISNFHKDGGSLEFDLKSQAGGEVSLPLLMYPYYTVSATDPAAEFDLRAGENNIMALHVNKDTDTHVHIYFKEPLSWRASEVVSAVALLSIAGIALGKYVTSKRGKGKRHSARLPK